MIRTGVKEGDGKKIEKEGVDSLRESDDSKRLFHLIDRRLTKIRN
jgi:hypothetical protein